MHTGDLVRVINSDVPPPIEIGDLAILIEVDWEEVVTDSRGRKITGRGYFYFPNKPEAQRKFQWKGKPPGVMLLFENFEVISESR